MFLLCVHYNYVWLKVGHTEVNWYGSSSCGFPAWKITEYFKLIVHIGDNKIYKIVVSPGVATCVEHCAATVQVVV